jgi:Putative lumazine-binding
MIHGTIPMREKSGQEMLREVRSHGPADLPEADKTEQITVLDVAGSIASAKLVTPGWVDYLTLEKSEGEWKILSVVQRIDN